ncbi:MAG: LLM class F420-dependent oxidoreductase [Frankia sp.]
MELGIHVMHFNGPGGPENIGPELARAGQAAEAVGTANLSVMDHYFQMEQAAPATDPMLEGYSALSFLAAHTSTVRLGLLVTGVTYRHPGLLAKIVATLDVLSGGRAQLGLGAAWYEREHLGLGVPFPPVAERFERLEEALRICRQMWSDDDGPFDGRHYQLAETLCSPRPLSSPRPPILIGGVGEKKTLRLVAQYADACNLFASSPDFVAQKLDVLRGHCAAIGRDYADIKKTIVTSLSVDDGDAFLTEVAQYAKLGVEQVIVGPPRGESAAAWIESRLGPIAPLLAQIEPAA